jgi:asparagine synthase (glutamine-hydrolysing)
MCGIVGKINFNKKIVTEKEIKKMTKVLAHRGPDDAGVFIDQNVGLGHHRLAIIDLSAQGHQPMSDNDNKIWLTYNGEIYNFLDLRKELAKEGIKFKSRTDTEVIIYLYKKYGLDCFSYLRGMFALAIWDKNKKQLILARDRLGQKPLKYYFDNNCFIFASELKAILQAKEVSKEPDWEAVDEYLTYKYVPGPKTGFKNIYKLPPAHYLIIKENGEQIMQRYWQIDYLKKSELSEPAWEKKIIEKLTQAVRLRLISDVPIGAHLSGGIDSSLIVALMAQALPQRVKTFSIGFQEKKYNELPFAKMVAKRYHTDHHELIIKPNAVEILPKLVYHYEEPYADASALPTWYLSEATKQHMAVALNGDGGDENFAGYERYNAMKLHAQLKKIPGKNIIKTLNQLFYRLTGAKIFQKGYRLTNSFHPSPYNFYLNIIQYFSPGEKDKIYTANFKKLIEHSDWYRASQKVFDQGKKLNWLDQLLYTGLHTHLPDDLLAKVDIASMAHSLEIRSPFLDFEFLELTAQMPARLKLAGHNKKYLLKKIATKYLPKECIYRPKQGFTIPLEFWFRGRLNNYLQDSILDKKFLAYGFAWQGIAKMINDHEKHRHNYENQLWTLLCLRLWLKEWFE